MCSSDLYERALDVRQADVADVDEMQEAGKVVVNALEAGLEFAHGLFSAPFVRRAVVSAPP